MFTNHYDVKIKDDNGNDIVAKLRLPLGAQYELKKKYKEEDTKSLILSAASEDEKFVDVITSSLNWKGNDNTVTDGEELFERLVDSGDMGVIPRYLIMIGVGTASGVFTKKESEAFLRDIYAKEDMIFSNDGVGDGSPVESDIDYDDTEVDEKNV